MKVISVFGTRPEAIKMAPLVKALDEHPAFDSKVAVTAQHREMLDQVLDIFQIKPDFDLNLMAPKQSLSELTSKILTGITQVFEEEQPDLVLVHGDTTTTFAVSLAAFYQKIKIGHVEAGLRTNNLQSPWPEEANRQLTDVLADYYFAPTEGAAQNLRNEGKDPSKIFVTGNTAIDSLLMVTDLIDQSSEMKAKIQKSLLNQTYDINSGRPFVLITGHRRENFGDGIKEICKSLQVLAENHSDYDFVYPVHLNPQIKEPVQELLTGYKNIYLLEPLNYEEFVYLMSQCYLILTDSGGIQEEAPSLGKPVLLMRDTTERPEAVEAGVVKLVGTDSRRIVEEVTRLIGDGGAYGGMSVGVNPFGDGLSAKRILQNNFSF